MNDLIAETKAYLLQNHALTDRVFADKESYDYFVSFAMQNKTEVKQAPPIKKAPPPLPIKPAPIIQKKYKAPPKPVEAVVPPTKRVELLPQEKRDAADYTDLKKSFAKNFPNVAIIDTAPDDIVAKVRKQKEADVIIVSDNDNPKQNAFLHHLAIAIDRTHAPATVLSQHEIEGQHPKLFIGINRNLPEPKLLIQPISSYLNNPQLKAKLWEEIQNHFKRV